MEKTRRSGCRVTAVVVTYNRKELLAECLQALLAQTVFEPNAEGAAGEAAAEISEEAATEIAKERGRKAAGCELEILVVDNASTDGTASSLSPLLEREPRIHYMLL